jgi:hypothetical protein
MQLFPAGRDLPPPAGDAIDKSDPQKAQVSSVALNLKSNEADRLARARVRYGRGVGHGGAPNLAIYSPNVLAKALESPTQNDVRCVNNLIVTPAKAGVQGRRRNFDPGFPLARE